MHTTVLVQKGITHLLLKTVRMTVTSLLFNMVCFVFNQTSTINYNHEHVLVHLFLNWLTFSVLIILVFDH